MANEGDYYTAFSDDIDDDLWDTPIMNSEGLRCGQSGKLESFPVFRLVALLECLCILPWYVGIIDGKSCAVVCVSILFTWFHIWLALWMCFYPLEFRGISTPYGRLGWQGIVPRKAYKMANKSCDLMIDRLIIVDDLVDRICSRSVCSFLRRMGYMVAIETHVTTVVKQNLFSKYVPVAVQERLLRQSGAVADTVCVDIVSQLKGLLKDRKFFDIRDLIVSEFVRDKKLLVHLFTVTGRNELLFIECSGAIMGFVCGVVQLVLWKASICREVNPYLLFSIAGIVIGYFTNWFALFMIFNPIEPIVISWPPGLSRLFSTKQGKYNKRPFLTVHGLFLKRQIEASQMYSKIVTDSVLNVPKMVEFLCSKKNIATRITHEIIPTCMSRAITEHMRSIPLSSYMDVPHITRITSDATVSFVQTNSYSMFHSLSRFIESQLLLRETIYQKLCLLPSAEFEQMLHPVFQEDEWILILLGGVLGGLVGLMQVFFFSL